GAAAQAADFGLQLAGKVLALVGEGMEQGLQLRAVHAVRGRAEPFFAVLASLDQAVEGVNAFLVVGIHGTSFVGESAEKRSRPGESESTPVVLPAYHGGARSVPLGRRGATKMRGRLSAPPHSSPAGTCAALPLP